MPVLAAPHGLQLCGGRECISGQNGFCLWLLHLCLATEVFSLGFKTRDRLFSLLCLLVDPALFKMSSVHVWVRISRHFIPDRISWAIYLQLFQNYFSGKNTNLTSYFSCNICLNQTDCIFFFILANYTSVVKKQIELACGEAPSVNCTW